VASRAHTAADPYRIGGYGVTRPSPPHSPVGGAGPNNSKQQQFRTYSTATVGSAASVGRFSTHEETLEEQTSAVLDAIPIESQAQDLNDRVAAEFKQAREKVEDWIETHVQCNYKVSYDILKYATRYNQILIFAVILKLCSPQSAPWWS
jgi:hypothetical protein